MAPLVSRVLVALVGLPLVLLVVWAGGWWLFALAAVAAVLALHEYALMIRSLRPVILAAYAGALLSLVGAHLGGLQWTMAGFLSTMVLAFLLHWIATTRQSATVAIASTVLGAGWIGLCLAHLLLVRQIPSEGELATFTVLLAVWAGDIGAFLAGTSWRPHCRRGRPGRAFCSGPRRRSSSRSSPCTNSTTSRSGSRSCSAS